MLGSHFTEFRVRMFSNVKLTESGFGFANPKPEVTTNEYNTDSDIVPQTG